MESELSTQARAKGAAMNNFHASEKLNTLHQQARTHNNLLEISRNRRQRQQRERRQAWRNLWLAITTLIRLEFFGNTHARA
jgi:hypothetical protein